MNEILRTLALFNFVLASALFLSGYARAEEVAAVAAVSPTEVLKSFWAAIAPAINDAALYAYAITWLAAFAPKAGEDSGLVWKAIRALIDLLAANIKNASNHP